MLCRIQNAEHRGESREWLRRLSRRRSCTLAGASTPSWHPGRRSGRRGATEQEKEVLDAMVQLRALKRTARRDRHTTIQTAQIVHRWTLRATTRPATGLRGYRVDATACASQIPPGYMSSRLLSSPPTRAKHPPALSVSLPPRPAHISGGRCEAACGGRVLLAVPRSMCYVARYVEPMKR